MNDTNDEDAHMREVLAGLRAQVDSAERERDAARAELAAVRAELEALRSGLERISQAWRYVCKQLG